MSAAAPARLVDPAGQPVVAGEVKIASIFDLPSVWQMEANVEWLVETIVPRRSINLLSAESGTGKSWLAYAIAGAVAHGASFIGRKVEQRHVLYLDGENPLAVVKRNLTDLGIPATPNLHIWAGWTKEPPPGPDDARIIEFVRQHHPLLIWDSLVEFAECDEQSSTEIRAFMRNFRTLAHLGATVLLLHHTGKSRSSKQYRGSSDIKASVDTAYVVTGTERNGKLHRLVVEPFKTRIAPGEKFAMEFHQGRGFSPIEVAGQSKPVDAEEIVRGIVAEHPRTNASYIKNLASPRGVSKGRVDEILKNGDYSIEGGRGPEKLYTARPRMAGAS